VDGKWREPDSDSDMPFNGLTLESVTLADVTADGINEAIVILRYDTGGTQYSHYVYIYSIGSTLAVSVVIVTTQLPRSFSS